MSETPTEKLRKVRAWLAEHAEEGATSEEVRRLAHELRDRRMAAGGVPHGTRSRHNYHGCRCDACRKANADYIRQRRKEGKQA